MKALSLQQPWAGAVAHLGKTVENRGWGTSWRGRFAIHATVGLRTRREYLENLAHVAEVTGRPVAELEPYVAVRGAVVATAVLRRICTASVDGRVCECGPWAISGRRHLLLEEVRPLPEPVPLTGRLGLWQLPPGIKPAITAQVGR